MNLTLFTSHFEGVEDPRQESKVTHPLFDILFVSLCAVAAGAEGWQDIEEYAHGYLDWFQEHGFLSNGVPVDDTIARIMSRIEPKQFRQCFIQWMQSVHKLSGGALVAIDGKTLRGSYNREDRFSTIHMVNAYACENRIVIGQLRTDTKSNEITAIPHLIQLLDIKGALVSIDAMGCQKDIAEAIIKKKADYLLTVKANQETLFEAIKHEFSAIGSTSDTQLEKHHGRVEAREYEVLTVSGRKKGFSGWKNIKTIGRAISFHQKKGKPPHIEYRYYISSANLTKEQFAQAVRGHWGIESRLHWVLDATMKEDDCQIYKDNGPENLAVLRQLSLNMLRAEPTKISMRRKQKRAWMKVEFLEQILAAGLSDIGKN